MFHYLQAIFFFDQYLSIMLVVLNTCFLCFKTFHLGFPTGQLRLEFCICAVYGFLCFCRIKAGMKGYAIEAASWLLLMIFLSVFSLYCNAYFLRYQTYV